MTSVSFGPIDSFASFHQALRDLRAYAFGARAPADAELAAALRGEIAAITAWTAHGRTPRLSERMAVRLGWVIREAREAGGPFDAETEQMLDLASNLVWFFANWPPSDAAARDRRFRGPMAGPRVPEAGELAPVLTAIAEALAAAGPAEDPPPPEAFESDAPLFADRMTLTQWTRYVLLPRLAAMAAGEADLPETSDLAALAQPLAFEERTWPLLYALGQLDDLFLEADPDDAEAPPAAPPDRPDPVARPPAPEAPPPIPILFPSAARRHGVSGESAQLMIEPGALRITGAGAAGGGAYRLPIAAVTKARFRFSSASRHRLWDEWQIHLTLDGESEVLILSGFPRLARRWHRAVEQIAGLLLAEGRATLVAGDLGSAVNRLVVALFTGAVLAAVFYGVAPSLFNPALREPGWPGPLPLVILGLRILLFLTVGTLYQLYLTIRFDWPRRIRKQRQIAAWLPGPRLTGASR